MHRRLAVFFSILVVGSAHAAIEQDFRCLLATDTKKPVGVEFRTIGDPSVSWSVGWVLYKGSKQAIPLVLAKSVVTDRSLRPWQFEDTWVEVLDGRITGTYVEEHQGANIVGFTYTSAKDGRKVSFEQDLQHTGEHACEW